MATVKPIFLRPVEITTSNNGWSVWLNPPGDTGNAENALTISTGVYGSVLNVAAAMVTQMNAITGWTVTGAMVQSGDETYINFAFTDDTGNSTAPEYEWGEIYDVIGSASASKGNFDTDTAFPELDRWIVSMTYRPLYTWIPTYQSAEQGRFNIQQAEIFSGNMSRSGFLAGNQTGPVIYWRNLNFVNEPAENIYESAATSARYKNRNLETFVKGCRVSNPSVAGNGSVRGFYFFPDWSDIQVGATYLTLSTNGGINFDYDSSPDTYAFCQMNTRGYADPQSSLPTTKTRYSTAFQIHTVDYTVSWDY